MDKYGCVVVFSSFLLHVLLYGTIQSFGVLYVELLDDFQKGRGETSWIASLSSGIMFLFAPVSTYMEKRIGCRALGMVGALLVSIGMTLSSIIKNIHFLYLTYGICSGAGFCLMCTAATIPVHLYFHERRTLAYALASSGICVGTVLTPFLIRFLLIEYSWRGTFLLMGGINAHGCVAAALLWKPYSLKGDTQKTVAPRREDSWLTDVRTIYRDKAFLLFITSNMVVVLVYFVPFVMTPDLAYRRGLTKDEGAFLITVFGLAGAVGRVFSGYLADATPEHKAMINAGQLLGASVAIFWSAYIHDFPQFIGYSVLFGIFGSSWAMLAAVLTVDIAGKQLYVVAMGLVWLHSGLFSTIGSPIAGWITDVSGSYEVTFLVAGSLFLLGAILRVILAFQKLHLPQNYNNKSELFPTSQSMDLHELT